MQAADKYISASTKSYPLATNLVVQKQNDTVFASLNIHNALSNTGYLYYSVQLGVTVLGEQRTPGRCKPGEQHVSGHRSGKHLRSHGNVLLRQEWQHLTLTLCRKESMAETFVCTEEGTPKTERNVSGCLSLIPVHSPCICLPLFGFLAKQEVFWFSRSPNCPAIPTPWDEWCSPGDPVTVTCSGNLWRWLLFTGSSAWSQTRDGIHRTPEAASGEGTCLPIHNTLAFSMYPQPNVNFT